MSEEKIENCICGKAPRVFSNPYGWYVECCVGTAFEGWTELNPDSPYEDKAKPRAIRKWNWSIESRMKAKEENDFLAEVSKDKKFIKTLTNLRKAVIMKT
jgi:hypothetical protein